MNDEVKVILDYLKDDKWDYYPSDGIPYKVFLMEERDKLLDYINNLQEENEFLKLNNPEMNIEHFRIVKENKRKIDNLRKENEDLKDRLKVMEHFKNSLQEENKKLKELCDKYEEEHSNEFKIWKNERHQILDYKSRCEKALKELKEIRQSTFTKYNSNEWGNCLSYNDDIEPLENTLNGGDE